MADRFIKLRGVEVHNLKSIDLDLPHRKLIVLCGVSGSGKSSLAFDTLYAEGQRRYIESFSAYTRQFLERLEKPTAQSIDGIPPAIAVAAQTGARSSRSTVGTATEIHDYLRLLIARVGQIHCTSCAREVVRHTAQSIADELATQPAATKYQIAFTLGEAADAAQLRQLVASGFIRAVVGDGIVDLSAADLESLAQQRQGAPWDIVVDRLSAGDTTNSRTLDSLEAALDHGRGRAVVYVEANDTPQPDSRGRILKIDGRTWRRVAYSTRLRCEDCDLDYPEPEPRLFSFNSPLGACTECEGFGNVMDVDLDLVVPDKSKSIRDGAIAPWNTPAYEHERKELLALADDYGLPVNIPFAELSDDHRKLIFEGVPEREFGGLRGFFAWLERRKYKMHVRVFLSRWRGYKLCPKCSGARLRAEALAIRIGGKNIAEICALEVQQARPFLDELPLSPWAQAISGSMLEQVRSRLRFLEAVGLGYLTLDRPMRTLSGGETQRVMLTSALGSSLVNMLYVLDEPSVGLHARDTARLIETIRSLRNRGNSVLVVEHEEAMIRAADHVVEIGPGAGDRGGSVVFQGTPAEMEKCTSSLTGDYLARRRVFHTPERRRQPNHGWIRLAGARGNNLQNLSVDFPLNVLCVVTGVSGSGKSTLVQDTLYPALCRRMRKDADRPAPYDDVFGDGQINDVLLVDQSPIGRSPRSNPVTYIKAFDEIRAVFADTLDARTRNYTASHFSFNVDGGRCTACDGDGYLRIDMQFLADVYVKCSECHGRRYRREILDILYRGRNIADVLEMTVREAFSFFRGSAKVQNALKKLIDVGLDYLRLGQPANTLSGGEAQRLKLAGYMSSARRGRTLFILDEPTTGLHFFDVVQLLDCFEALLAVGHSLIVVEHNLEVMKAADYIIDLGPGAANEGGRVVAQGTPELVSRSAESITARYLAEILSSDRKGKTA